jgi:hypothetical protein
MTFLTILKMAALGLSLCIIACGVPPKTEDRDSLRHVAGTWVAEPHLTTFSWPEEPDGIVSALELGIARAAGYRVPREDIDISNPLFWLNVAEGPGTDALFSVFLTYCRGAGKMYPPGAG